MDQDDYEIGGWNRAAESNKRGQVIRHPNAPAEPGPGMSELWATAEAWKEAEIPLRPWIATGYLLRGAVTVAAGTPGAGKSSLMVGWATACALGVTFGRFNPGARLRVLTYNVEDDEPEQRRRFSAGLRQLGRGPEEFGDRLLRVGPKQVGTLIEQDRNTGDFRLTPAFDKLEELAKLHRPDVVFLDPMAELHSSDENDNTSLRHVLAVLRAFSKRHDCAVCLVHHGRKGGLAGDLETIRGAGSIVGAARIAATIVTMTEEEADRLEIPLSHRRLFFRFDTVKGNYSAPAVSAEWFEMVEHELDNGERVAAAHPWEPPATGKGESPETLALLAAAIERGTASGPYSPRLSHDEPRSIAPVLARHGITPSDLRRTVERLLESGIEVQEYRDQYRKVRKGLRGSGGPAAQWLDGKHNPE